MREEWKRKELTCGRPDCTATDERPGPQRRRCGQAGVAPEEGRRRCMSASMARGGGGGGRTGLRR